VAVDDVSFRVEKGQIVGFLGPNGAGKSTTLRILAGFLGMTAGKVEICGHDVEGESLEARRSVGYMPEAVPLYPEMRVVEYLTFRAELKGVARSKRRAHVDDAMDKASVFDVANTLIGKLSKGYRQRVGLADALVANPPLLILDEPTAGLDPNQIRQVRELIAGLSGDHTVLLSTHILSEVEQSCDRVILIAKGKLLAEGKTADIRKMRRAAALEITVRGDAARALRILRAVQGVAKVKEAPTKEAPTATFHVTWTKKLADSDVDATIEAAVAALVGAGLGVREVAPVGSSLEDVFTELTRDAAAEPLEGSPA